MKKICFVTAARSEYGLLKWLMKDVASSDDFEFQLIVTGGHLLKEQGHTIDQILQDGFHVDYKVDAHLDTGTAGSIASSMGRMAEGISAAFEKLNPDHLAVLGDRYELLPICSSAFMMNIPIIHISGGDVTEGAIDNSIRNAVTMLSSFHFPGTEESAERIKRMRGSGNNIWAVGEPGLDALKRESLMDRKELAKSLDIDVDSKWILMTFHPETLDSEEANINTVNNLCSSLSEIKGIQVIMTYANADPGGSRINAFLEQAAEKEKDAFRCIPSLGSLRYLSMLKESAMMIGNSSSGIVEAPSLGIPVVNIGNRQKGRYMCSNIIQCGKTREEISYAVNKALNCQPDLSDIDHWGDGNTSGRILSILKSVL